MANDDYKYKELPRASGKIAPAQWNPETGEWEVFTGLAKVQDVDVKTELESIKQTQSQILAKLNDTIDTRLTGSIMDDVESVPVKGRKLEWYASDGFNINIEPGGTYFFRDSDFLNYTDSFKDLSEYEYYYIGVQSETSHDFKAFTRSKLLGSVGISKDVIADGVGSVRQIDKEHITHHDVSIRITNESEESKNYMLMAGFWPM